MLTGVELGVPDAGAELEGEEAAVVSAGGVTAAGVADEGGADEGVDDVEVSAGAEPDEGFSGSTAGVPPLPFVSFESDLLSLVSIAF